MGTQHGRVCAAETVGHTAHLDVAQRHDARVLFGEVGDSLEECIRREQNDARRGVCTHHGVGLARARRAIGKDARVGATHHISDDLLCRAIEDAGLRDGWPERMVKGVRLRHESDEDNH